MEAPSQILDLRVRSPILLRCAPCSERFCDRLTKREGIQDIQIDPGRARVRLIYDPASQSAERLEAIVQEACDALEREFDHQTYEIAGMDCPDCAITVQRAVSNLPGALWVDVDFAASRLSMEYDPKALALNRVTSAVRHAGYRAIVPGQVQKSRDLATWGLLALGGAGLLLSFLATVGPWLAWLIVAGYGAPIVLAAVRSLALRRITMHTLMTLAIIGALSIGEHIEAAMLVWLFALGSAVQNRALLKTRSALASLLELAPPVARAIIDGQEREIPVSELEIGMLIEVRPGERCPIDGTVISGETSMNESALTGESLPVDKRLGSLVLAGSLNGQGIIRVEVAKPYADTTLAKMIEAAQGSGSSKSETHQAIDRFAAWYTPAVIGLAALVALGGSQFFGLPMPDALHRALWLLVVACPCALVIATPVAIVAALGSASKQGAMVKGGDVLERLAKIDRVALDKTGTLTYSSVQLADHCFVNDAASAIAGSLAALNDHPLSRATALRLTDRLPVESYALYSGQGVEGSVNGQSYRFGSLEFATNERQVPAAIAQFIETNKGASVAALSDRTSVIAAFAFADTVRPDAKDAVTELLDMGVRVTALSGDQPEAVERVAKEMGVTDWRAGLTPQEKRELIEQSPHVAMIGDGINDVLALQSASVGIAMGAAGSDAAVEAADAALMRDDLRAVPKLIRLARRTSSVIRQNILISVVTKALLIGLGIAMPIGLWAAVLGDTGVSLLVTLNAARLLRTPR